MMRAYLAITCIVTGGLIAALRFSDPAFAIVAGTGFWAIEEVPIERLLQNIERNRDEKDLHQYLTSLARVHLLAYIRQTKTLPASTRGGTRENEEVVDEGPFIDCKPIAPLPRKSTTKRGGGAFIPPGKCSTEDRQFDFLARRGLPEGTLAVRHPADDHLRLAVSAYERAKTMKPARIRTRLALAYAYDRLGKIDKALLQLRYIIDTADVTLPKFQSGGKYGEDRYWDYQIVAAEAVEHLMMISKSTTDVERIKKLRPKLKTPEKMELYMTPIFVPLNDATGIGAFIDPAADVSFDLTGQGLPLKGGWITRDAAWLVWDPGNKQKIASGFQLFGSVTWLTPWENGYLALAALDDNGDGKIAGTELKGLSLWRDTNANGVSDKGEVKPVTDWQITALGYRHKRQSKDAWISEAGVTFANGETRPTYDWNIRTQLITAEAQ